VNPYPSRSAPTSHTHRLRGSDPGRGPLPSETPSLVDAEDYDGDKSRRHVCRRCGKRFNRPSSLTIHYHTHTGERRECYQFSSPSTPRSWFFDPFGALVVPYLFFRSLSLPAPGLPENVQRRVEYEATSPEPRIPSQESTTTSTDNPSTFCLFPSIPTRYVPATTITTQVRIVYESFSLSFLGLEVSCGGMARAGVTNLGGVSTTR